MMDAARVDICKSGVQEQWRGNGGMVRCTSRAEQQEWDKLQPQSEHNARTLIRRFPSVGGDTGYFWIIPKSLLNIPCRAAQTQLIFTASPRSSLHHRIFTSSSRLGFSFSWARGLSVLITSCFGFSAPSNFLSLLNKMNHVFDIVEFICWQQIEQFC